MGPWRANRGSRSRSAPLRAPVIDPNRSSPSANSHSIPEIRGDPSARNVAIVLCRPASNRCRTAGSELRLRLLDLAPRRHGPSLFVARGAPAGPPARDASTLRRIDGGPHRPAGAAANRAVPRSPPGPRPVGTGRGPPTPVSPVPRCPRRRRGARRPRSRLHGRRSLRPPSPHRRPAGRPLRGRPRRVRRSGRPPLRRATRSTKSRAAPGRSRHQPVGRDPTTFAASMRSTAAVTSLRTDGATRSRQRPVRSRCAHPGQQQGRRLPSSSSSWVRRMRRSRVACCLASSTQQTNSFRASGVMSFHASSAVGLARRARPHVRGKLGAPLHRGPVDRSWGPR